MKQKNGGWIALFLAPACILFILIFAIPLVMVFVTSLFDYRLLPRTFTFVGFSNFVQLFTEDNRFWPIFGNTVKWLFIHCIFHVTLGTLLAFILYKKPRGWKFVRVTYMIPNIISQSAIAMIFLNLYNAQYGAVNSFLKLVGLESLQHNWLFETATAFPSVTLTWFLFAGYTTTLVLARALTSDVCVCVLCVVETRRPEREHSISSAAASEENAAAQGGGRARAGSHRWLVTEHHFCLTAL